MSDRLRKAIKHTLGVALALMLFGCNSTYEMQVDAIKNPAPTTPQADSYILVPRDPATDTNDLRYQETVKWIKTALSAKGMYEANDPQSADMVIEVDYGIEPPRQETEVVEEPVFVNVREPGHYERVAIRDPKTGKTVIQTIYVAGAVRSELAGYQARTITKIINEKYLVLTATGNTLAEDGDKAAEELWSVSVVNRDDSENLREYLPILASAATDYIGEDTQTEQTVRLKENDDVVAFVKKGLAKPSL